MCGRGHFEGEEHLPVDQTGGGPELEEVLTAPSVSGLPEALHLQFCDIAFHESSSSCALLGTALTARGDRQLYPYCGTDRSLPAAGSLL